MQSRRYRRERGLVSAKGERGQVRHPDDPGGEQPASGDPPVSPEKYEKNTKDETMRREIKKGGPNRKSRQTQTDPRKTICVITHSEQAHHPQQENKRRATSAGSRAKTKKKN